MTGEDLERPLTPRRKPPRRKPRVDGVAVLAFGVGSVLALVGFWALLVRDPLGGEPIATASIERRPPAPLAQAKMETETPAAAAEDGDVPRRGVPVVRPGEPMPKSGPVIISIPGAGDSPDGSAGPPAAAQTALLEDSRYGQLPRIAADGRRPLDVYAAKAPAAGGPRVALVVAGLGVGRELTQSAIGSLPGAVTLAFSPYGQDLKELVDRARAAGHEVLIQAPMEPFGYPGNDTGPQTMLTSLPASANLERLRWTLSRASGFVGVAPLGGGRFLEAEAATAPVFTELARRGLMFVAPSGGQEAGFVPVADRSGLARAPVATPIDASADPAMIDAALAELEAKAKAAPGTVVVGWASATPLSLKRIEQWRAGLSARGVALAPVSAALRPQGPS